MNKRTFSANANFYFEYHHNIDDEDDPQQAVDVDQKFFGDDPLFLHDHYDYIHCEVVIEDITNMTTPEENDDMSNIEPRIELAIRDWWSNRCEKEALKVQETEIAVQKRELVEEAKVLTRRLEGLTENIRRHLMFNVYEDCFVILVWDPVIDSHTIEVMRNEFGDKA